MNIEIKGVVDLESAEGYEKPLQRILEGSPWKKKKLLKAVKNLEWQAYCVYVDSTLKAIALTEISRTHNDKKWLSVIACGGFDREEWQHELVSFFEICARASGYEGFSLIARKGWERVLKKHHGLNSSHVILEKRF